jgi:hypothetical protein
MAGVYGGCERPCVSRVKTLRWSVLIEQRARTPARPEGGSVYRSVQVVTDDFCAPRFPRNEINEAGAILAGVIPGDQEGVRKATDAFLKAYNWRDSHMLPLVSVRRELMGFGRRCAKGSISAARPKRMSSIRKKLADPNNTIKLSQIQDLVGCRLIVPDRSCLRSVLGLYLGGESKHQIKHTDYVGSPRLSGYRGHHLIAKFIDPDNSIAYRGLKVEIQLRTILQHSWATAVEAVGLIRGEELKSGKGCPKWLRLFALVSSEMADMEEAERVPFTPETRTERSAEIAAINNDIGALNLIRKFNASFKLSENYLPKTNRPYYLLQYDASRNEVKIRAFHDFATGANLEHASGNSEGNVTSVIVSVEKVDDLRAAYPNYFMDLEGFALVLSNAITCEPFDKIEVVTKKDTPSYLRDLSWLKNFERGSNKT